MGPWKIWLERALNSSTEPEVLAKALYLNFKTRNPFIYISSQAFEVAKKLIQQSLTPEEQSSFINEAMQTKTAYFLTEISMAAFTRELNRWGYTQEASHATLALLFQKKLAPEKSKKFARDIIYFLQTLKFSLLLN